MAIFRWVYRFHGCPGLDDFEEICAVEEPVWGVIRERGDTCGVLDGYILESLDPETCVACFAWAKTGTPETVMGFLLEAFDDARRQDWDR